MKIAFFCDAFAPTHSGVAVSAGTTAAELRRRGHQVVVFAPRYTGYEEAEQDVVRFPAGHWYRATDFPVAWPGLPELSLPAQVRFGRDRFDIVHTHSPFTLGFVGAGWARRQGTPVVFTFHTLYHRYLHYVPLPADVTRTYIVWKLRRHMRRCTHVIAPSRPVLQIVHRLAPDVPCTVLPTGIAVGRFAGGDGAAVRRRYGIPGDAVVLLYVGRLVPEKNLVFLLKSVSPLLAAQTPPVHLMLVGGGPASGMLQELTRELGIADHVTFTGFIESHGIADYYAAADIFTFASRTETQGVSIAEAMAAGLACVVVGAMGAAEAVQHDVNGLTVGPHEASFRKAVERLLQDAGLRRRLAAAARAGAHDLSIEHRVDELLGLYGRMVEQAASMQPTVSPSE